MKQHLESLIQHALKNLQTEGEWTGAAGPSFIQIDATKDPAHGDYATNVALILAKSLKQKPRDVATLIIKHLPLDDRIAKVEVAGPGFINFFLASAGLTEVVRTILAEKAAFGRSIMGRGKRILVEFVSSNPTGPLHVGHGRHAAFGAVIANLLEAVGFKVYREYYVNDAGRQMDILTVSLWLRYLALCTPDIPFAFPANAYQGDYVIDIATLALQAEGDHWQCPLDQVFVDLPKDEPDGGDKELYIDALIARAKQLLGERYDRVAEFALEHVLGDIRDDLSQMGVHYDNWFSEKQFVETELVDAWLEKFKTNLYVYEQEGALWFKATAFGDEKDRVLVRANGQRTYFANDVIYHLSKFERGFDLAIDIFGADHHGYVPRIKAAMQASDINPERLQHLLVQFVSLYRSGVPIPMSTRAGQFVTLRALREEVGNDATRYFYVMRKADQPMDFDLDLAKSQSNDNPVYYIQYAYARIASVMRQLIDKQAVYNEGNGLMHLHLLIEQEERELLNKLAQYPDVITHAALQYEPHALTNYLRELAGVFHTYYNAQAFLVDDKALRDARLCLVMAVRQTLHNGFQLLGITLPESM